MKKVVSWSFGRSSSYLVIQMLEKFGPENVDIVAMDTGAEHELTYEFAKQFDSYILKTYGKSITYLRTDFSSPLGAGNSYHVLSVNEIGQDLKPFSEMMKKYGAPYIGGMFCTDRMKLVPYTKYCKEKYGKGNYETWLGIRADEPKRLSTKKGIRYLAEISDFEKQDILNFWAKMPFDLEIYEWNGNCVFCPKKSDLKLAAAQRDNPEAYIGFLDAIGADDVRKVLTRTQEFIDSTGFKFYPERFYNRSGNFIKKVLAYNSSRYEIAAQMASKKMYRGKKSLEQVVAMFDGATGSEIKARIRGSKMTDTGSCSESCEVFNCSID